MMAVRLKRSAKNIHSISIFSEKQIRNTVNEDNNPINRGAIENPVELADGNEIFVRLSPFENDRRVDKVNKCLLAGSFTTTMEDYLICKALNDNPVERYALPKNDKIKFAFHIQPSKKDSLQRGIVQTAYERKGGGKETYFANGTTKDTFIKQTPY